MQCKLPLGDARLDRELALLADGAVGEADDAADPHCNAAQATISVDTVQRTVLCRLPAVIKGGVVITFAAQLNTAAYPDPDLLIRTSGEYRISNFLLWQISYSEIFITKTLWPDFRRDNLLEAVGEYQKRQRRFGGV